MKKITSILFLVICSQSLYAWGFWGHQKINRMACFTLPPEMFAFYKAHIDYLTEHAVDPDKRRYSDPAEAPRHFIDIDHYLPNPFDTIPQKWKDAVAKYSEDSLNKYGIVPWQIQKVYYQLIRAFTEKDISKILYYSATIGHYVADSHVPLHCSENYNGQLTNQTGIHGFWESRLPELFGDDYDKMPGHAVYIENIQDYCWRTVKQSFAALDSVLTFERNLNSSFDSDKKYAFEVRGNQMIRVYSKEYSGEYQSMLSGQVERRMYAAILSVGSIWYSAWVTAGMPQLNSEEIVIPVVEEEKSDTVKAMMGKRDCE
jgi:hypothetical protein